MKNDRPYAKEFFWGGFFITIAIMLCFDIRATITPASIATKAVNYYMEK